MSTDPEAFKHINFSTAKDMSEEVKNNLISIQKQVKEGTKTTEQALTEINGLMNTTVSQGTKLGNTFVNIGKTLLNGLASAAISAAITGIIYLVQTVADKLITTRKEAESLSNQFRDTFSSTASEQSRVIKEISEIDEEYQKLSKGVSALGENVSLTDDEFERYNQITQIIAQDMPELIQGYTKQGDAIIGLKGNVESLTEAYKENQKVAAQNLYEQTGEDDKRIVSGVFEKYKDDTAQKSYTEALSSDPGRVYTQIYDISRQLASQKRLAQATLDDLKTMNLNAYELDVLDNVGLDSDTIKDMTKEQFEEIHTRLQQGYNELYQTLDADAKRMGEIGLTYAKGYLDYFSSLSADQQKLYDAVMNSMDYEFISEKGWTSEEEIKNYAQEVMTAISGLTPDQTEELMLKVNLSTQWNNDELTYEEYLTKIQELDALLNALFGDNPEIIKSIKLLFDIPNQEDLEKKQDIFVNRIGEKRMAASRAAEKNQPTVLDTEHEKLLDWGRKAGTDYTKFEKDIDNGILHRFGNIDMDKRAIIKWSDELKKTYQKELDSWEYNPEVGSIDTVWGGSDSFNWDDEEHEIAFTPIMQTDHGAVFLGKDEVMNYIDSVIAKAGEDGEITAEEIFAIDATETGHMYGEQFGKGLIAGVDDVTGNKGIGARAAGDLMHFSGKFGAYALAKQADEQPTGSMAGMPSDVKQKLESQYASVADTWYDSLTLSQREFVDNISDEDLAEAVKFESTEQFDEWLKKLQADADENLKLDPTASDAVDSMNNAKSAITSLAGLYEQTVTKAVQDGLATGFADPATLTSIRSAFSEFSKDLENKGDQQGADTINKALQDFETTLVEFPGDADKAQSAMDKLITSYIDQTDVIQNLTEENAEWSKAQLEAMGITNAEEVVQSRLSKQVKATQKAIAGLARELENYNAVLENGDENAKAEAISKLVNPTKQALTNRDETGKALEGEQNAFLDNIDDSFVAAHIEDIQAMVDGDIDALNRLRLEAAKGAVMEVTTNVPTEAAEYQIQDLMNMVAQADAMNIEPGASIDDSDFIAKLNQMVQSGKYTVEQVNAAFESMGYEAKWKSNRTQIRVPNGAHATAIPTSAGGKDAGKTVTWDFKNENIDFPSLDIITKKGSSGGGVQAHYGGTPSTGSTGGGNGGGNNSGSSNKDNDKLAEETAETYDWIAVAIQRLDEEIARLDKQVNNTFKTWTDRNSTLRKEIEKVTEEIEAQKLAVKEYERNAALVSGSGQQLTEGQNKKITKAQKAWTTDLQQAIVDDKYTKTKKTTKTVKDKNGKKKKQTVTKKVLDTDKLKKALGDAYNGYIKDAAQELFNDVQADKKKAKKKADKEAKKKGNKKGKSKGSSKTTKTYDFSKYIVGDSNKPKKSDYDGNTKQYNADLKAWKEAQKQWATGTYQQKIREGTMTGTDIEQIKNKYLKEAINLYKEEYQKVVDVGDAIEDNKIKISEEYKELFENVTKEYDEMIAYIQNNADVVDKRIGLVEEMSYFVDARLYKNLIQSYSKIADDTQKKLDAQIKQFNEGVEKGALAPESEAWYDELSAIQATNSALVEAKTNVAKYNNEIKKGQWERVKFLGERLQRFKEEGDWIKELLSYKDLYDDQGRYNNRGWATSAIIGEQFEYAKSEAQRYKGLIEDFYKGVNSFAEHKYDPYSQDDIAEMDELNDAYRENISLIKEMAEANKDLVSESINKHLESLKKLIDEYNNSLSAAKDLYDFQKNVQSQTDNLNSIQRQLQAYGGDDSEEGRKRRQELRKQLQDAEQQLQETEWDRYISQTGKMLDNMYTDYEDFLNARLDDILVLMSDEIAATNDQKKAISEGLKETQNAFGADFKNWGRLVEDNFTTISSAITDALDNVKDSTDEITNPKDAKNPLYGLLGFSKDVWVDKDGKSALRISDFNQELENARKQEEQAQAQAEAARQAEEAAKAEKARQDELQRQRQANGGLTNDEVNNQLTNYKIYKEESEKTLPILEADLAKYEEERSRMLQDFELLKKKKDKAALQKKIDAKTASINDILSTIDNQKNMIDYYEDMIINLEKLKKANGFAVGSRNIPKKQMAWTQENGTELIFRSSDGAMLTPLNQGDMVFTAQMTQRLWELASGMIPNSLGGQKLPNISSNNNNTINNNNEIVISLPNVNDYESFKQELQNDSRFEKFIQEVTIGQAMGNNSLSKRKY